jgi:uncharacterized membrane protein YfhO
VPVGSHRIIVEYKPRSFAIGVLLLLATLLILLILNVRRIYREKASVAAVP